MVVGFLVGLAVVGSCSGEVLREDGYQGDCFFGTGPMFEHMPTSTSAAPTQLLWRGVRRM